MIDDIKKLLIKLSTRFPIYKALPASKYRDYAAVEYLNRTDQQAVASYLMDYGRLPAWRHSTMVTAASAAFIHGQDEAGIEIASAALSSYPDMIEARLLLADFCRFHGDYPAGARHARDAWLLSPTSVSAALKAIRLSYLDGPRTSADVLALVAMERFPESEKILWSACKHCQSKDQFDRILQTWHIEPKTDRQLSAGARPLGLAALHVGLFDVAMDIYARACLIEVRGQGLGTKLPEKSLAGTGALSVLEDLCAALKSAGTPFFFAAGTALGLARDGRPIDHDDDIDVGIFEEDWDRSALVSTFSRQGHFSIEASHPDMQKVRLSHRSGAGIDIFRFYREGDSVFHDGNFVRWKNSPFGIERHASSESLYVPGNIDRYLRENYGDWRTPDRSFDAFVDAPNVEVTVPAYWNVHRLRRAYKFIRGSDMAAARREVAAVSGLLMQSPIGSELIRELQP